MAVSPPSRHHRGRLLLQRSPVIAGIHHLGRSGFLASVGELSGSVGPARFHTGGRSPATAGRVRPDDASVHERPTSGGPRAAAALLAAIHALTIHEDAGLEIHQAEVIPGTAAERAP